MLSWLYAHGCTQIWLENHDVCPKTKSGTLLYRVKVFEFFFQTCIWALSAHRGTRHGGLAKKVKNTSVSLYSNYVGMSWKASGEKSHVKYFKLLFIGLKFLPRRSLSIHLACSWWLSKSPRQCMKCRCVSLTQVILGFIGSTFPFKGPRPLEILYCKNSAASEASLAGKEEEPGLHLAWFPVFKKDEWPALSYWECPHLWHSVWSQHHGRKQLERERVLNVKAILNESRWTGPTTGP